MRSLERKGLSLVMGLSLFIWCSASSVAAPVVRAFNVFCNAYPGAGGAINEGVTADRMLLNDLLREQISQQGWGVEVDITEVVGAQATAEKIFAAWTAFSKTVGPEDTVFVYFSGHGAIDRASNLQLLQACDLKLIGRKDWADAIDGLGCRLKIFITDCCSSFTAVEVAEGDEEVTPWSSLYHLLLLHEGFVNISAASPGEKAYATSIGSFLTVNLHSDMQRYKSWDKVFRETRKRVMAETVRDAPQRQTPVAHSLGKPIPIEGPSSRRLPDSVSYVIPDSNSRLLNRAELEMMGLQQLYLARNEIVARHGYDFSTPLLRKYFAAQPWYRGRSGKKDYKLNSIEGKNAELIKKIEIENGGPFITSVGTPAGQSEAPDIFPYSSDRPLSRPVVESLNPMQLSIARNEIFARHGFPFSSETLQKYFALKPGYARRAGATDPRLNPVEKQNIWLIKKIERVKGGAHKWD